MSDYEDIEHRRLEGTLAEVVQLARQGNRLGAANVFGEFRRSLRGHLDQEERLTLPDFRRRTGDPYGMVPIIEDQHRELERALDRVSMAIAAADDARFCASLLELDARLSAHQAAEELLLSPSPDDAPALPA